MKPRRQGLREQPSNGPFMSQCLYPVEAPNGRSLINCRGTGVDKHDGDRRLGSKSATQSYENPDRPAMVRP
jgi:hypothetical protein